MSENVTATELSRNLADYLNRVSYRGETFVVHRGGRPIAELQPHARRVTGREFLASLASEPHLTPEEAASFGEDIDRAREEMGPAPDSNPWDS